MRRKVIQIADSTQLISLPRKWAIKYGIKKGDEVDVEESGQELIISSLSTSAKEKALELQIDNPSRFLRRLLFSPYIQGYTELKVNYKDPKVFDLVSDEVQLLMGYEIIQQGANYCTIKSVATELDNDLDVIIRRIFVSTISMMEDLSSGLSESDYLKLDNLKNLEVTNNKLSYFCLRILNKKGYHDSNKTNSIYYTILLIEEIVDELRDICTHVSSRKLKVSKSTIKVAQDCLKYFRKTNDLFHNFDSDALFDFNKGVKDLSRRIVELLQKPENDGVVLSFYHNIINKISHISKEIHY